MPQFFRRYARINFNVGISRIVRALYVRDSFNRDHYVTLSVLMGAGYHMFNRQFRGNSRMSRLAYRTLAGRSIVITIPNDRRGFRVRMGVNWNKLYAR